MCCALCSQYKSVQAVALVQWQVLPLLDPDMCFPCPTLQLFSSDTSPTSVKSSLLLVIIFGHLWEKVFCISDRGINLQT